MQEIYFFLLVYRIFLLFQKYNNIPKNIYPKSMQQVEVVKIPRLKIFLRLNLPN